jgi:adenylate cyclase
LSDDNRDDFHRSALYVAYTHGKATRINLEAPPEEEEYGRLQQFRDAGLTDYVIMALPFADGTNKAITYATDRPGGFNEHEVSVFEAVRTLYATIMETRYLRHLAGTLMNTYVGPSAGQRVLDGAIKRGVGETIRAAIWFCDLKDFTRLSEMLPGPQLLELLNDYFDVMTEAIEAEGGEILKFVGDAILAIFQQSEGEDEAEASRRALRAACVAQASAVIRNKSREDTDKPVFGYGIALHFGDLIYGNVGGQNRLDFTVIGPAVNLASRIESLTRELEKPILLSAEFVALHGGSFEDLGRFKFKGVSEERTVYAPK